jgi:hypothetical protein
VSERERERERERDLGAQEHARKVYVDDGLPVLILHAEDQGIPGDTRVVDEGGDGFVEVLFDLLEHCRHLVGVRSVGLCDRIQVCIGISRSILLYIGTSLFCFILQRWCSITCALAGICRRERVAGAGRRGARGGARGYLDLDGHGLDAHALDLLGNGLSGVLGASIVDNDVGAAAQVRQV